VRPRKTVPGTARLIAVAIALPTAFATTGLVAPAAQSAVDRECPTAAATADLQVGQPVDGATVSQGTTPAAFQGTVEGVMENGIGPGLDLVMVRLSSPEIDRVGGIWQGMSGSPVYTADDQLIGAVAYGLAFGPSTLAGVTPAAEMQKMLTSAPSAATAPPETVRLPASLKTRLARSGVATTAQLNAGLSQLRMPVGVSGLTSRRFQQVAPVLRLGDVQPMATGTQAVSEDPIGIVAGGNMAASLSNGLVTAAGIGTATMVCGTEVVGFGHPFNFTGTSTMRLHGASAVGIQEDPTVAGFKLANLGAPIGTVTEDHLAGIKGVVGNQPVSGTISATSQVGAAQQSGTTTVSVPDVFVDTAFLHLLAVQDRVLDRVGKGAGTVAWTIRGVRQNGRPFAFSYSDLFADPFDISFAPAVALAGHLVALQENGREDVRMTSVTASTRLDRPFSSFTIRRVDHRIHGAWVPMSQARTVGMPAGTTRRLRITLVSRQTATRQVIVRVRVPAGAAGGFGQLQVIGGNSGAFDDSAFLDEGFGFFDEGIGQTVPQVIAGLKAIPKHNEVVATLRFPGAPGTARRPTTGKATLGRVVDGGRFFSVRAR